MRVGGACRAVLVLAICGCGRIAFDPLGAAGDALDASVCGPWTQATQFTPPMRVVELGSFDEQQPHLSADGLTIYFVSARTGDYHIYIGERGARDQPFANVRLLNEVNSTTYDTAFAPTLDQLTAYLSSNRNTGQADLWITQRAATTEVFDTPIPLAVSTTFIDYDPFPSSDRLRLYWAILGWDQGVGATDLVVATRTSPTDNFGAPSLLAGLSTAAVDDNPSETADGRMLVFSSDRSGAGDVYFATRATPTTPYTAPVRMPTINDTAAEETEPYVTPDGCEVWFVSNRAGNYEIYVTAVIP